MPTTHTRRRAYNITPGDKVIILGAPHGETVMKPYTWTVKAVTDHDAEIYLESYDEGAKLKMVRKPAQRTFILTAGEVRGGRTYEYTVNRDQSIVVNP